MGRAHHCSAEERRLVHELRKQGQSQGFIAKSIGRSLCFVQNALKSKRSVETRGIPKKTTPSTDHHIVALAKRDPFKSSKAIAKEIDNEVTSRTVRRRLVSSNLPSRMARRVPLLRNANLQKRKNFALAHKTWSGPEGEKKWRNILWSDETKICLFGNDAERHVRRPKGKEFHVRFTKKTVKHGGGNIMVWGCFSWQGVGPIYQIDGIMDRFVYKNLLKTTMLPYAEENMPLLWTFQQDNDPKHSSKLVKEWFRDQKINVMEWPS